MSVLAIIPARAGSTRLKDKNLRKLGGRTLVEWAVKVASESCCERIIVSTNDPTIACGNEYILRPEEISGASSDISQALKYTLEESEKKGSKYEWVITLQPTIPCRPNGMIDSMLSVIKKENAKSAVTTLPSVPWMWRCFNDGSAANEWHPLSYPRSQDFEAHGSWQAEINCITITHHSVIRQGKRWDLPLLLCFLPLWANIDIDNLSDLNDANKRWPALSNWMEEPVNNISYYKVNNIRSLHA
jgi:CMP-N-acetylneuraminic acid synthetase